MSNSSDSSEIFDFAPQAAKKLSVAETLQLARAKSQTVKESPVTYAEYNGEKAVTSNLWNEAAPEAIEVKKDNKGTSVEALVKELQSVDASYINSYSFHVTIWKAIDKLCENNNFLSDLLSTARDRENDLSREYFEYQTRNSILNEIDILSVTQKIIENQILELQNKSQGVSKKISLLVRDGKSPSKGSTSIGAIAKAYQEIKSKMHQSPNTVGLIKGMKESNLAQKAPSKQLPRSAGAASAALVGKDL